MPKPYLRMEMTGFAELDRALRELPKSVARSVLRKALLQAGEVVVHAARAAVPVDTGALAASIAQTSSLTKSQRRGRARAGDVETFIGPSVKGWYGHLVEFGTSKMAARPFLRPAWDANRDAVLQGLKDHIWEQIDRAARRLAKMGAAARRSMF